MASLLFWAICLMEGSEILERSQLPPRILIVRLLFTPQVRYLKPAFPLLRFSQAC